VYSQRPAARSSVARDVEGIAGTVQLHPAWAPNQPHRAEIAKLLVHRRSRRTGLATQLMQAIEDAAQRAFTKRYRAEMKRPCAPCALSREADFSVGCYCEEEARCHRSVLKALLREHGASLA
jgi:GNAT superfamily N-acetyltransferase